MYDENIVGPMREELTRQGVVEMRTAEEVDRVMKDEQGTVLVVINSVCGCAAGGARPGVALALKHGRLPSRAVTVFAGQDKAATARVREYLAEYPPSSPAFALLRSGKVLKMLHRSDIEGRSPQEIAMLLKSMFDSYC